MTFNLFLKVISDGLNALRSVSIPCNLRTSPLLLVIRLGMNGDVSNGIHGFH